MLPIEKLHKGQTLSAKVVSLSFGGRGIVKYDHFIFFIPHTAVGDEIKFRITKLKKNHGVGEVIEFIQKGASRTTPLCPYFQKCGGCHFQHISYEEQAKAKVSFVADSIKHHSKISTPPLALIPPQETWKYRKHITLQMRKKGAGFTFGYIHHDNVSLVPIKKCPIFAHLDDPIFEQIEYLLENLSNTGINKATLKLIKSESKYLLGFSFFPNFPGGFKHQIESFLNAHSNIVSIHIKTPKEERKFGKKNPTISLLDLKIAYSPYSFLQSHLPEAKKLYESLVNLVPSNTKKALDLYSGIGITSLLLGRQNIKTYAIESNERAVKLAKKNAKENKVENVTFIQGRVEEKIASFLTLNQVELVIANPPRTGLTKEVTESILNSNAQRIIYISCMPITLAKDVSIFTKDKYELVSYQPFDLFPQTTHVETLLVLDKKRA